MNYFISRLYIYIFNITFEFLRYDRCIMSLPILDQTYAELVKSYIPKEAKNMVSNEKAFYNSTFKINV